MSLVSLTVVTGRLLLPPLLPTIIAEFGISLFAAGLLLSILQGTTALALFPSGHLSDQLTRSTVIIPALFILTVGILLIGSATVYLVLVAGAVIYGLGNGLFQTAGRTLISDHFVDRRGQALGVFGSAFSIGAVLASGIAIITVARWRQSFFAIAGVFTIITVLFVYWNHEPLVLRPIEFELWSTIRRLFTTRELREPIIAFSLFGIVTQSIIGFFPAYLQDIKGFSPTWASIGFGLLFAVGVVSKYTAGRLSDRISRRYIATAGMALTGIALLGIVIVDSAVLLFSLIILFAVGHQAQFPLIDAILLDSASEANAGGDLGAGKTIMLLVGSIGPAYVGFIAGAYSYSHAFAGLLLLILAIVIVLLADPDRVTARS